MNIEMPEYLFFFLRRFGLNKLDRDAHELPWLQGKQLISGSRDW